MRITIIPDDTYGKGVAPEYATWDTLEWSDETLLKDSKARGLLARMIAQSIQEWAEHVQVNRKILTSRNQREAAKEEVETELQRQREEGPD